MDMLTVHKLGPALIKALGAPPHCTLLELRLAYDEIPTVKCEYYPVGDDGTIDATAKMLGEYELVPRAVLDDGEFVVRPIGAAPYVVSVHPKGSPEFQACRAQIIGFDAWMRERTERAHAEYMAAHAAGGIAYT